jgi:hypothetical protein
VDGSCAADGLQRRGTTIMLVMQRLHLEDLAGHLLEKGGFEHLCLPANRPSSEECRKIAVKWCQGTKYHDHHLSIAARDPQHVAEVLAEFMGGAATRFTPNPGSWFAHQHDEYGTGVEVYPGAVAGNVEDAVSGDSKSVAP